MTLQNLSFSNLVTSTPPEIQTNGSVTGDRAKHGSLDTLIHLGAGKCAELNQHRSLCPSRILLVEGDKVLSEQLGAKTADIAEVEVINEVVSNERAPRVFHHFNQPDLNSLQTPDSKLIELFPGLRSVRDETVETQDLEKLFDSHDVQSNTSNRLIVDLPGMEQHIITVLQRNREKPIFNQIRWTLSDDLLYEGSSHKDTLIEQLHELGFELTEKYPTLDSHFTYAEFKFNPLRIENQKLQQEIQALQSQHTELTREHKHLQKKSVLLTGNLDIARQSLDKLQKQISDLKQNNETQSGTIRGLEKQVLSTEKLLKKKNGELENVKSELERINLYRKQDLSNIQDQELLKQSLEATIQGLKNQYSGIYLKFEKLASFVVEQQSCIQANVISSDAVDQPPDTLDSKAELRSETDQSAGAARSPFSSKGAGNEINNQDPNSGIDEKLLAIQSAFQVLGAETANLRKAMEGKDRNLSVQASELDEAKSTIRLLTKLAALRDNDLKDLQSQHQELSMVCEDQARIIKTIEDKLITEEHRLTKTIHKQRGAKRQSNRTKSTPSSNSKR